MVGLRSTRLHDYLITEYAEGLIQLPIDRRLTQDAQPHRYLMTTLFKEVQSMIVRQKTTYSIQRIVN